MRAEKVMEVRELGQLIRARRKERGYTQEAVASFVGCSTKFLSELERGKTTAEIGKVIPIIHILGMDLYVHRRGA